MVSGPPESPAPGAGDGTDRPRTDHLASLLDEAGIGRLRLTDEKLIATVDAAFAESTGYARDELEGRPFATILADGRSTADANPNEPVTVSIRTRSGANRPCALVETADGYEGLLTPSQQPAGGTGSTDEPDAEPPSESEPETSASSELTYGRTFEALADALPDGIIVLDRTSDVQYANPAVERILGHPPEELEGSSKVNIIPPRLRETHLNALQRYLETGERHIDWTYVELPGQHADGHEVPLGISLNDFTYEGERYFVGLFRDVSSRKTAERTLTAKVVQLESVAYLGRRALETSDVDDLFAKAVELVAASLDADYCKVLDLGPAGDELLLREGVGWDEGIVGEATVSATESDSQAGYTLSSEEPVVVEDLTTEPRFGGPALLTDHDVKSGMSVTIGPTSDPWGILGVHDTDRREFADHDVDFLESVATILATAIEHRRYERRLNETVEFLEESNERLEQFAYAASHDLQEPLRMISSYLQLLERRYADQLDEDAAEFIAFTVDGADRMREMIDGLLEYSRIDSQGEPFEPVDLDEVVADVRRDLEVAITESEAEIEVESLPRVFGDESQLRQLFQNLLSNAIEYSGDEPPRIRVTVEREGCEYVVSVSDEGIGIDPSESERVFRVFQRLHSRSEYEGTGIGLALCQRIVERHGVRASEANSSSAGSQSESVGGRIWVDSEPGEGSTFSFTLPVDANAADGGLDG
ncbi:ATP-binding protein [Natrialbaceae archaeon GCM10025810]|uniref:PAS domain-containing sensor histidine kinase n=1 Tax=Halovalidus salilacus TaxID=3075124 RepID=UPI003610E4BC